MAKTNLTAHRLKELLDYDPETGVFTWNNPSPPNRFKHGVKAGTIGAKGHIVIKLADQSYKAHRLAWLYVIGEWPKDQIDHMNGVPDDNRFENLRECNTAINCQNQHHPRKNNTSGYRGVHWNTWYGLWEASISVNMKRIVLGRFNTPAEAGAVYAEAKRLYHIHTPVIK